MLSRRESLAIACVSSIPLARFGTEWRMADQHTSTEGNTIRAPFTRFEAAKTYAQAMRALSYATTIAVQNGFWVVTATLPEDPAHSEGSTGLSDL